MHGTEYMGEQMSLFALWDRLSRTDYPGTIKIRTKGPSINEVALNSAFFLPFHVIVFSTGGLYVFGGAPLAFKTWWLLSSL